jgi:uncharacterized protein (DUF2147 family)
MALKQDRYPMQARAVKQRSGYRKPGHSRLRRATVRLAACATLLLACIGVPAQRTWAAAAVPSGVWLMGTTVAIQIFDCSEMLCGRVIWLKAPLDPQGLLKRDKLNPDPALRQRQVCGPTIIWNLRPKGNNIWEDGWFYNPDDGETYRISMELKSADEIVARVYWGLAIFGESRTLVRVPMGTSEGWC